MEIFIRFVFDSFAIVPVLQFCLFVKGITHPNCENDTFIIDEQLALCHDLKRALHFMMYCDDTTPHNKFILMMFFLEQGDLDDDFDKQVMV